MKHLVFSDGHVGDYAEGWIDPDTKLNTRLLDTLAVWDWVRELAIAEKVDAVVFVGDRFRSRRPPYWMRDLADEKVQAISQAGIEQYLLVGNHDQYDKAGTWNSFNGLRIHAKNAPIHVIDRPTLYPLSSFGTMMFVPFGFTDEVLFDPPRESGRRTNVLFFHDDVAGVSNYGAFRAKGGIPKSYIDKPEWSLILVGHVHMRQDLGLEATQGFHVGSPLERVEDGPQGPKGALLIEYTENGTKGEFVESPFPCILRHEFDIGDSTQCDLSNLQDVAGNVIVATIYHTGQADGRLRRDVLERLREMGARSAKVQLELKPRVDRNVTVSNVNTKLPLDAQIVEWARHQTDDEDVVEKLSSITQPE